MQTDRHTGRWTESNWIFRKSLSSTESERQRQGKRERQTGRETDKQTASQAERDRERQKQSKREREKQSRTERFMPKVYAHVCFFWLQTSSILNVFSNVKSTFQADPGNDSHSLFNN